jgi:hypothetical protein
MNKDEYKQLYEQVCEQYDVLAKELATIKQALAAQHEPENEPFVSLASVQEPVAWLIPGSITTDPELAKANGDKAVALGKISTQQWNPEDHYKDGWRDALESVKRATPPAAQPAPVQPMAHIVGEIDHTGKVWKPVQPAPVQEPVYHLRQFGDVTKEQLDRYMETGDINPQPAPVQAVQEADVFDDDIEVTGPTTIRTRYRLEVGTKLYTTPPAAPVQELWEPSDTAHRPGGLPQDFTKHEVESFDDWSEWVNPDSEQYFMKCCDCGLVHEMQFKVAKYSEGDECEFVADADLQAVFRARRTNPPAAQPAPVQEPVAWMHKETGLLRQANKAKGGDFEPNHWTPLYTTPPEQPAASEGWKLVPSVPTNEWVNNLAKMQTGNLEEVPFVEIHQCIAELLAAAPEKGQP